MSRIKFVLIVMFCVTIMNGWSQGNGLGPISTANLYTGTGILAPWQSFLTIAAALVTIGFAIRTVVVVKLAMTGERNVTQIVWTLIVAVIGFACLKALLGA